MSPPSPQANLPHDVALDPEVARLTAENAQLRRRLERAEAGALREQLRERNARLALVARTSQLLVLNEDTDAALQEVFSGFATSLGHELFFHFQIGDAPRTLVLAASGGLTQAQREHYATIRFGQYLCGKVAERREALIAEDLAGSPFAEAAALCAAGVRCYVGIPLLAQGNLLGTLAFATLSRDRLGEGELELLQTVCDQAAVQLARARSERQLRDRDRYLRMALDGSRGIAFDWDIVSDRVRRLVGLEGVLPESDGWLSTFESMTEAVHPDDRERFRASVRAALTAEDGHYSSQFRVVHPDGQVRWLEESGRVERDAAGRPIRMVGIGHDVTERKRAEQALRESESRLASVLQASPVGIALLDSEQRYVHINQALAAMNDLPVEAHLGRTIRQALGDRGADLLEPIFRQVLETGRPVLDHELGVEARGQLRTCLAQYVPVVDAATGALLGVSCVVADISARKAAETRLAASEARMELAMRIAAAGAWDADLVNDRTYWSASHFTLLGYEPTPTGEATAAMCEDAIPPEDLPGVLAEWQRAERARDTFRSHHRLRRTDGRTIWIDAAGQFFHDAQGRAVRFVGIFFDVTERREAVEALAQADRRKNEFIAVLAHELRNPLAPVRVAVQLLQRCSPAEPRLVRAAEVIDRQVTHMARLVDDLLDVSRITQGALLIERERCDLAAIARQTAEDYRAAFEAAGVCLTVTGVARPVWVDGDPVRLAQMVGNLLNNAARFVERGGSVRVSVEPDRALRSGVVQVADDGGGMEPELIARLFEAFSQAKQDLSRSKGGLGLGLALTRGLAALHGGEVRAHSEGLGRGSTFTIEIPLAGEPEQAVCAEPSDHGLAAGLRILVVEDNRDSAEALADLLALDDHEVGVAFDGATALAAAKTLLPDVIISDIGLPPPLDGFALARVFRAEPALRGTMLVALSGYVTAEDRRSAREAGFDAHLSKPPDLVQLQRILGDAARHKRAVAR